MYTLVYAKEALKQLKKLNKDAQVRILSTLERIRVRPYPHVKKLQNLHYNLSSSALNGENAPLREMEIYTKVGTPLYYKKNQD